MKQISVIVPVYKVEQYLSQCIKSILNQTYRNLELLLIDDGSPDECSIICDEYAHKDKRIKVFHKINEGLSEARNYGIARATGEYISFVDGDDWIEPDMLEVLLNSAEGNKANIVACAFFYDYPNQIEVNTVLDKRFDNTADLIKALINDEIDNHVWNKLYHRSCFSDIVFPKGHVYEDIFTMYKIFQNVTTAIFVSKPLYHYRINRPGAITQSRSIANMIDYWLAHKSRYDFFCDSSIYNADKELLDKLKYYCAISIVLVWGWCYSYSEQEKENYASFFNEMHDFCVQKIPTCGMKNWPLSVRIPIFLGRFDNNFTFALLYYLLQSYRWIRINIFCL